MTKIKNLFAWASIDEHGNIKGGLAGKQTGKELKTGYYYNFGQTNVLRFRNPSIGRRAAKIAKWLAKCNNIGYDQAERYTLYNLSSSNEWNFKKIKKALRTKKVECDCSSFCAAVINIAHKKRIVTCFSTGTISETYNPEYLTNLPISKVSKFKKGDMPYKPYKHIIINI